MPLADKLQEATAKYVAEIFLGLALSVVAGVALFADAVLPTEVFDFLGRYASGRLVLGLCIAILALVVWVIYLHPRLVFDERAANFVHRRIGTRYCSKMPY